MPLTNCEINLIIIWFASCVLTSGTPESQATTCAITNTKLYVSVVALSTDDNVKIINSQLTHN